MMIAIVMLVDADGEDTVFILTSAADDVAATVPIVVVVAFVRAKRR